jgi:hypothetical protein
MSAMALFEQRARIASYKPCIRIEPYANSVANAASRPSSPNFSSSDGINRFAYAWSSRTARNISMAASRGASGEDDIF